MKIVKLIVENNITTKPITNKIMTLKEKITKIALDMPLINSPTKKEISDYENGLSNLEQISDEFAIGFAEWIKLPRQRNEFANDLKTTILIAFKDLDRQEADKWHLSSYYKLNLRIHHLINQAANNPVLSRLFSQVNARIEALRFRSNQDGVKWEKAVEEHQEMLEALKARDSKRMRKIMMQHVMNKRDVVVQLLKAEASSSEVAEASK